MKISRNRVHKILFVILVIIPLFWNYQNIALSQSQVKNQEQKMKSSTLLTADMVTDPVIAKQNGLTGYIEIKFKQETDSLIKANKGASINIPIMLEYVSFDKSHKNATVSIDPRSGYGLSIQVPTELGYVTINDMVSYYPSGNIVLKAGESLEVTMTVKIPTNLPKGRYSFGAVGIWSKESIIDITEGKLDV